MAEDFARHGNPESNTSPHQLYRYEKDGSERLVALDFSDVAGLLIENRLATNGLPTF